MLRRALLAASASPRLRQLVTTAPQTRAIVEKYVAGETADDAVRVTRALRAAGLLVTLDYLGEDTKDPAQAAAVTDEYIQLARQARRGGTDPGRGRGDLGQADRGRAVPGHQDREGEHQPDLRGRARGGHHGDAGRRGVRRDRADAADRRRAARRVRRSRLRDPGVPAAQRGRLPRAGRLRDPGPAVQGRLQRAGERRLHRPPRDRHVVRALPAGADERRRLPDARHPRPAADRDHHVAGPADRPRPGQL